MSRQPKPRRFSFSIFETSTRPPMVMMHGCPSFAVTCSASPCRKILPSNRIFCTTPKTIRERVLVYLAAQSAKTGTDTFTIPFDRQGLADYLNLDRSALSKNSEKCRKRESSNFIKTNLRCVIRLSRRYRNVNFFTVSSFQMLIFHKRIYTKSIFRGYNHILFLLYPIFCTCKL